MKDNDIFYCSFLQSQKDTVEVRLSPHSAETIPHLYDLGRSFQICIRRLPSSVINRWREPSQSELHPDCESLLAKATPTYVWISSCSDVRTQQSSSSLSWAVSFLSVYRSHSMGAYGCPRSAAADMLLWLEVRWINVSALLWCRACFPIARLWLIKHIDWPVSGLEGWPTAALCGDASPPSLSLSLRLKEESTGCSAISAQHRKHIVSSSIFFNHSYGSDVPVSCCFLIRLNLRGSTSLYLCQ